MSAITVFVLCLIISNVLGHHVYINSNTTITTQVNIEVSAKPSKGNHVNLNVNVSGGGGLDGKHTKHTKSSRKKVVKPNVTDKPRSTRKAGELSEKKCQEYYPLIAPTPNVPYVQGDRSAQTNFQTTPKPVYIKAGTLSIKGEFPHMAIIGLHNNSGIRWICGGSLISYNFVLTAAHCLISEELIIRLEEHDLSNGLLYGIDNQDFKVKKIFPHPEYNKNSYNNHDIGLIELEKQVKLTYFVAPACLHTHRELDIHHPVTVTGWGQTDRYKPLSNLLMKADIVVVDNYVCNQLYKESKNIRFDIIDEKQICAIGLNKSDTCRGDSGGPLQVLRHYRVYDIAGITSFGGPCGEGKVPGVYTRVYHYLSWIENIVWP